MVEKLAARLKEEPGNVEGWVMLARSYGVLRRFAEAAQAYGRASSLRPDDAQLMVDHADALAMAQGRSLDGEPERLIAKAVGIDPANVKARLLAGTVAFEKRDFAGAVAHWRAALDRLPPDAQEMAESIRASITEAETKAGTGSGAGRAAAPA
ncbi:MAG TPA: c-type cytochrome biogenesis protein CcmI, partial [Rhodocyclaceae bacterium]|nr:c-type cytochrome biogenesis protein CcmI [Rhodocyclaceae bacterium]